MQGTKEMKKLRLTSFGCVTGLVFTHGGAAEMRMDQLEVKRLLDAWRKYEHSKRSPDEQTIAALRVLRKRVGRFDAAFVIESPIAQTRARIEPVV